MRLQLNQRTELAYLSLEVLERSGSSYVSGKRIADELDVSAQYLTKVLAPLARAGWLTTLTGPSGGYRLAIDLSEHCLLDLVEVVEGTVDRSRCMHGDSRNPADELCKLHTPWVKARDALLIELEMTPLAEVNEPELRNGGAA